MTQSGRNRTLGAWTQHKRRRRDLAPLSGSEAVLIGLAALAVVAIPFCWPLVEQFNVMAHEGAHALVAFAMGFKSDGVTIEVDNTGEPNTSTLP